jgi:hypothetical protein
MNYRQNEALKEILVVSQICSISFNICVHFEHRNCVLCTMVHVSIMKYAPKCVNM